MGETKKEIIARLKDIELKLDIVMSRFELLPGVKEPESLGGIQLAVQITGLAIPTIYSYVSERQIPHYKKGKRLYFKRSELEKWIEGGKRKTEEEIRSIARGCNKGKFPI